MADPEMDTSVPNPLSANKKHVHDTNRRTKMAVGPRPTIPPHLMAGIDGVVVCSGSGGCVEGARAVRINVQKDKTIALKVRPQHVYAYRG